MVRLREIRKSRGLTQEELGDLVGLTKASISFYESGKQDPGVDTLKRIADVLNVSVDNLLGREEQGEDGTLHTAEARILANGIDKMPKEQREQAIRIMQTVFEKYSDFFDEKGNKE